MRGTIAREPKWTAPSVVLTIISLFMAALGSYLAIQRSDNRENSALLQRIAGLEARVAGLERRER